MVFFTAKTGPFAGERAFDTMIARGDGFGMFVTDKHEPSDWCLGGIPLNAKIQGLVGAVCVQPASLVGLCLFVFSISWWDGVLGSDQKNVGDVALLVHWMAQVIDVEGKPFSQARDSCRHGGCPQMNNSFSQGKRGGRGEGQARYGHN